MKKLKYLILLVAVGLTACEDILDINPTSSLAFNGYWESEAAVNAAHSGLYGAFRGRSYTLWQMGELRSDLWGGKTFESPANEWIIEQTIDEENVPWSRWGYYYSVIHKLNDFITNAPAVQFVNEERKQRMIAEAYGMRAYFYFTLLKGWGNVPLTTEPQVELDLSALSRARDSEADVMAQIKKDLDASLTGFGDDDSYWRGRVYWSKSATLALKGEVYIWSGTHMGGGSADYNTAKTALQGITNAELLEDYASLFNFDNKDNDEFIFAFDYAIDEASNFYSLFTARTTEIIGTYDQNKDSVITYLESTNAASRYGISEKVLLAMNDPLDKRRDATLIMLYSEKPESPVYTEGDPTYLTSLLNKFMGTLDGGARKYVSDVPVYRYADVLLMLAEAKNLLDEDPSGEINQIIARAYGEDYDEDIHAYANGTKEENIQKILDERLKEFVGEGKRWWDLRRAGDSYVINNNSYLFPGDEYKLLLPISKDMIGRNPLLEPTEGYN